MVCSAQGLFALVSRFLHVRSPFAGEDPSAPPVSGDVRTKKAHLDRRSSGDCPCALTGFWSTAQLGQDRLNRRTQTVPLQDNRAVAPLMEGAYGTECMVEKPYTTYQCYF